MPGSFILKFRSAAVTDASGRRRRLHAVRAAKSATRRPIRLTFTATGEEIGLELTEREAIALAEWLDEAVTQVK